MKYLSAGAISTEIQTLVHFMSLIIREQLSSTGDAGAEGNELGPEIFVRGGTGV